MHDEACPIYEDMIDNMMKGQQFVLKEFGIAPRIGWQIDPFGHSNTNARLFHEMGFDAMFFGRMDSGESGIRLERKETMWVQEPVQNEFGKDYKVLFHWLKNSYVFPGGFNYDISGGDKMWENDKTFVDTYDAPDEAKHLDEFLTDYATCYVSNDLFILFGMDFQYMDAFQNYRSMDRMIEYMNKNYADKWNL